MLSPLFAAATLVLTYQLGRCLWPARTDVSRMAPFILLSSLLYFYFASALMFDAMATFFVVLGWLGLVQAWRKPAGHGGWVLFTLGLASASCRNRAFASPCSWSLPDRAVPRIAALTVLAEIGLLASLSVAMRQPCDVQAVANHIAAFQNEGRPVAVSGEYHGQWHLAGRLMAPLSEVPAADVRAWLEKQHHGRVVFPFRERSELPHGARVLHVFWYRGNQLAILGPPRPTSAAAPGPEPCGRAAPARYQIALENSPAPHADAGAAARSL
jgi:hypothetical protein